MRSPKASVKKEKIIWLTVLGCLVSYVIFAALTGIKIPCFYYTKFGVKCPGCGVTRMFLSMIHLDFYTAFWFNPIMFILFFIWLFIAFFYFWGRFAFFKNPLFLKCSLIISLVIAGIFGIVRNFY
ncbi:MAG: DUF2752 domain-containing protein [Ruminococcaceae bacterium]|nr:DUF2752 domain-containing protein [Oscillospiraceae bacterium]